MDTLIKAATVAIFAVLLYFVIDYIVGNISNAIDVNSIAPTIKYYMCRLGIFDAVNIFVSLLIASWFTNKLLNYLSG